jgi:RNA polymerase sigma-70 factor (ECF subfamily)
MEQQTVHAMTFLPDDQAARTAAFEELFQQNWEQVYQVLFRLTGDRAEAEDLALETFWRLWQDPPRQSGPLGGWLYRVATRLGYNALRSARRRLQYELHAGKNALDQSAPPVPEAESERSAQRRRIRLVLAKMDSRQAQALILRQAGLSYQEIAAALNVKPASVGSLLLRAEKEFVKRDEETDASF